MLIYLKIPIFVRMQKPGSGHLPPPIQPEQTAVDGQNKSFFVVYRPAKESIMRPAVARHLLIALIPAFIAACAGPQLAPATADGEAPAARALLQQSAAAHGLAAFEQIRDISVSYDGKWSWLVRRLQPTLIDADFRGSAQERLILGRPPLLAQQHSGPGGSKQVVRKDKDVQVSYNGEASSDPEVRAAAALVADGYRMFLTGPFYFLSGNHSLSPGPDAEIEGRTCASIVAVRRPGHGLSREDRYQLFIDRDGHLLRRVRFTMEGLASTQGAVAEVDFFDHKQIAGVTWPTRFHERLRQPIPGLSVHDWRLTGLDVNRGLEAAEIDGPAFTGKAVVPARSLAGPAD